MHFINSLVSGGKESEEKNENHPTSVEDKQELVESSNNKKNNKAIKKSISAEENSCEGLSPSRDS